jgi:hypothetical protein
MPSQLTAGQACLEALTRASRRLHWLGRGRRRSPALSKDGLLLASREQATPPPDFVWTWSRVPLQQGPFPAGPGVPFQQGPFPGFDGGPRVKPTRACWGRLTPCIFDLDTDHLLAQLTHRSTALSRLGPGFESKSGHPLVCRMARS